MNKYIFILLTFFVFFISYASCLSKWSVNGHYYEFIGASASTVSDALTKISKMNPQPDGSKPYLGTLTSLEELRYVQALIPLYGSVIVSGSRMDRWDEWKYLSGDEVNQTMFTQSTSQYASYTMWPYGFPSEQPDAQFLYITRNDQYLRNVGWVAAGNYWFYLVEWSLSDPYVPPVRTAGAITKMTNLDKFVVDYLTITLIPVGMLPINCTIISRDSHYKTVDFEVPPMMGNGLAHIIVDDGYTTFNISNWKYLAPVAYSIYPSLQLNTLMTIVGDNFGVDKSLITVTTGVLNNPCTYVKIIEDHKVISCIVSHYVTNVVFMYPLTITVGASSPIASNRIPFYDPENVKMIKFSPSASTLTSVYNSILDARASYSLDGNRMYSGIVDSANQVALMNAVFNFATMGTVYLGLIGLGYNSTARVRNGGGPYDNLVAVEQNKCSSFLYCFGGNFVGSSDLNGQTSFGGGNYAKSGDGALSAGLFGQFGGRPLIEPQTFLIDAGGGMVIVPLSSGSVGFRYTKRSYSINGVPQNGTITVINSRTLGIPIPPSILTNFNLSISIEAFTFTNLTVEYTPPTIVSVKSISTLGGPITVYGFSFGADSSAITVMLDDKTCDNPRLLVENTVLTCMLPPGVGANHLLVVNAGNYTSNATFSYLPPSIQDIQQQDTTLTIYGSSCGTPDFIPTVFVPYGSTPNMTFTDPQILTTTVPVYAQNGKVVVSVGGQSGSMSFVYQPFLESIYPLVLPVTEGGVITITGKFLTQHRTDGTQTSTSITVGGRQCLSPQYSYNTNYTYIQCVAPAGTGITADVIVTIDAKRSNTLKLGYPAPSISSYIQNRNSLTIVGANFGPDTTKVYIEINGNLFTPTQLLTNPSRIYATVPTSLKNGYIKVIVDGQHSNIFSLSLTPIIDTISQASIFGGDVSITGLYFNINDSSSNPQPLNISIGSVPCANPKIFKVNALIVCQVIPGTGIKDFNFKLGNTTISSLYNYIPPAISSIKFFANNESLLVTGTNIGFQQELMSLYVTAGTPSDSAILTPYEVFGDNQVQNLLFTIPEDIYNGNIYFILDGLKSNIVYLRVQPTITKVVSDIPTTGGLVTVYGRHFRDVRSGGVSVPYYFWVSNAVSGGSYCNIQTFTLNNVTCLVSQGVGAKNTISFYYDSVYSNTQFVTFKKPTIAEIIQNGGSLTLNGTNFGYTRIEALAQFNNLTVQPSTVAHTLVNTQIPWNSLNGNLSISITGQASNIFDYRLRPIIQGVSSVDRTGGILTLYGLFLNDVRYNGESTNPTIFFPNEVPCSDLKSLPNDETVKQSRLTCIAPPGNGTDIPVVITIDGLSTTTLFTYGSPVITNVQVSTDNLITITGDQFGTNETAITVTLGSLNVTTLQSLSNTEIVFKAPLKAMNDYLFVTSNRNGKQSTKFYVQLYPIISSITPATTNGGRATIYGSYFNPLKLGNVNTNIVIMINGYYVGIVNINPANTTFIVINAPLGSGTGLNATVSIEGLKNTIYTFNYLPPVITSTSQNKQILTLYGSNFGRDSTLTQLTPSYSIISVLDGAISVNVPSSAQNGPFSVQVNGQKSANFNVKLTPVITTIKSVPVTGGDITINGFFLNNRRSDATPLSIDVNVNGTKCEFKAVISNIGVICTLPPKNFLFAPINVTIDGMVATGQYSSNGPTATKMIKSTLFQVPDIITIGGVNFYDPLSVFIQDHECMFAMTLDEQTLVCTFDATVQPSVSLLPVTIYSSNVASTANIFAYDDLSCQKNCSNNGKCFNGQCACNIGYGGSLCHVAVNLTVPLPETNATAGVFTIGQDVFTAGIKFLREVTIGFVTVKTIPMESLNFTLTSTEEVGDYILEKSVGIIPDNPESLFRIEVSTYKLKYGRVFEFAGEKISVDTHSFKQNVQVFNWRFADLSNTLQVIYLGDSPATIENSCNTTSSTNLTLFQSNEGESRLLSFDFENDLGIFTGRFATRMVRDGILEIMSVTAIDLSDPIWPSKDGHVKTLVAMNIPHFESNAKFDPSFSAYRKNSSSQCITPTPTPTPTSAITTSTQTTQSITNSITVDSTTKSSTGQDPSTTNQQTTTGQSTTNSNTQTTSTTTNGGNPSDTLSGSSVPVITTNSGGSNTGPYKTCPGTPVCSGHGLCNSTTLICQCYGGYGGAECGGKVTPPVTPKPDPEKPSSNQTTDKAQVNIDVISLREITYEGTLVAEYSSLNWTFQQYNTSVKSSFIYQTKVVGNTLLNVTIDTFMETSSVVFAGESMIMQAGTIKYSASITKYPFKNPNNRLILVISASLVDNSTTDSCSNTQVDIDDTTGNVRSISLQVNGHTLYGRFQSKIIMDGRIIDTTSTILPSNDTSQTPSKAKVNVGMVLALGQFEQYSIADPDFSLLLGSDAKNKNGSMCSSKKKLSTGQIVGIAIGAAAAAAVIGIITGYTIHKKRKENAENNSINSKMSKINRS